MESGGISKQTEKQRPTEKICGLFCAIHELVCKRLFRYNIDNLQKGRVQNGII